MGGEQSRDGGGRCTEVANFDFRDLSHDKDDGSENSGTYGTRSEKEEMNSWQEERNKSAWERGGQGEERLEANGERVNCFAGFDNKTAVMHGRS